MRFALLSIVNLRDVPFISLLIYQTDERGISALIGEIAKPYNDIADLVDDLYAYEIKELQTDSKELYRELISAQYPVIYRREVDGTREAVENHEDIIVELYGLDEQDKKQAPVIPKWRLWLIDKLEKVIQILKTKGIKTNGN